MFFGHVQKKLSIPLRSVKFCFWTFLLFAKRWYNFSLVNYDEPHLLSRKSYLSFKSPWWGVRWISSCLEPDQDSRRFQKWLRGRLGPFGIFFFWMSLPQGRKEFWRSYNFRGTNGFLHHFHHSIFLLPPSPSQMIVQIPTSCRGFLQKHDESHNADQFNSLSTLHSGHIRVPMLVIVHLWQSRDILTPF